MAPPEFTRIHVAPGRYDASLGEQFPLIVPGGVSLEGAGREATSIVGAGWYNQELNGGIHYFPALTTFVVGDPLRTTSISGLSVLPSLETEPTAYGIFCNRGNAVAAGEPTNAPNTWLSDLHIGPHFGHGIVVVNSMREEPTGCNLRLTSSVVEGVDLGLAALGCDHPAGIGSIPVAAQVGDGTVLGGNEFRNIRVPGNTALGIQLRGCVSHFSATYNRFIASDAGISISQPVRDVQRPNQVEIVGNRFEHLTNFGVLLEGAGMNVTRFRENLFTRIARPSRVEGYRAVGLVVQGWYKSDTDEPAEMPRLALRANSFVGNDIGVTFRWAELSDQYVPPDFGTADDPGLNEFRCNSSKMGGGMDVALHVTRRSLSPLHFSLVGNTWDHAPPEATYSEPSDGIDIATWHPNILDFTAAMVSPDACPMGTKP